MATQVISSTRQRILDEALALFATKGYAPVTVVEIADAVGIKAPSLYKHYKSKQDIFDAIVTEMEARYEKYMASMHMSGTDAAGDFPRFSTITEDDLVETIGRQLFLYYLHDEYMSKFRKMLMIEHHANGELAALYARLYIDDRLSYQDALFMRLISAGIFRPEDSEIMSLQFYAPQFLLLSMCDCHPEREEEAIEMAGRHIRQFLRLYRRPIADIDEKNIQNNKL